MTLIWTPTNGSMFMIAMRATRVVGEVAKTGNGWNAFLYKETAKTLLGNYKDSDSAKAAVVTAVERDA